MVMAIFSIIVSVGVVLTIFKCIQLNREINSVEPVVYEEDDDDLEEPVVVPAMSIAEIEMAVAQEAREDAVYQAEFDRQFIISQLEEYESLYREAKIKRDNAIRDCDWDEKQMASSSGSAITGKAVELHKKEREKYRKQCLKYASTIHALENRLAKVENIINNS